MSTLLKLPTAATSSQDPRAGGQLPYAVHLEKLHLNALGFRILFAELGPSLALWRAAEVAALRTQTFDPPVMELGCGDGLVSSLVLDHIDIGVDPHLEAAARAVARGIYARVEPHPLESIHIQPRSVRTVISNSTMEHISALDPVLEAVSHALAPGGRFVFTVPTEAFSQWLVLPLTRYAAWRNAAYGHVNLWPVERWRRTLAAHGFHIECVRPYLRRSLVAAWDAIEVPQMFTPVRKWVVAPAWRRIPSRWLASMAERASRLDLGAPEPGGGRLIAARRWTA